MNRSWVRFPQAAQIRPPGSGWAFLYGCLLLVPHGCSGRRRARPPARLGNLASLGAASRSPPVPSGPSGALHTGGAWSLMHGSVRRLEARPGPATAHRHRGRSLRRPPRQWGLVCLRMVRRVGSLSGQALPPPMGTPAVPSGPSNVVCFVVLGFWGAPLCVVTNVVNPTAFSLKIKVFGRRLTTFVTEVLARRCESRWFDDVCNIGRPLVARPGPASARGRCGQALPTRRPACLKPPSPLLAGTRVGLKPSSPLWVLVESRLKPSSPLRVPAEPQLKPPSPLRVRIGCFWRVFRLHWCCRFQWVLFRGEHW